MPQQLLAGLSGCLTCGCVCLVGLETGSQEKGQRSWVELWPVERKGGAERYRVSSGASEVSTVKTRSRKNRMLKSPGKAAGCGKQGVDAQPSASKLPWENPAEI